MNITEAFAKIAANNDVHYVSISMNMTQVAASARWLASVQWEGFSRDGIGCAQEHGATPEEALQRTLEMARIDRSPIEPAADPLEVELAA